MVLAVAAVMVVGMAVVMVVEVVVVGMAVVWWWSR